MDIPLYIFLAIYAVGLFIFLLWGAFHLYHMIKFGMFDFTGKLNTFLFLALSLFFLLMTILLLREISWTETVRVFDVRSLRENVDFFNRL